MWTKWFSISIICGPNGSAYQLFSKNIHLDYYLRRGLDIICWNYRGYGFSTGKPSYNNIRNDVIELYNEIKKLDKYKKIGVHGISIGGIPACHLSSEKRDIQLLISDRNFGQIEYIIRTLPIGYFLIYFYKIFLFQKTRTIDDYLNTKCYKIVLNDPMDTIVKECGSLKTLTSEEIINNYLIKYNSSSPNNINNEIIPLSSYSSSVKNDDKRKKKNSLDFLLDKEEDKEIFINCLLDICDEVNLNKKEINDIKDKDSSDEIIVDEVEKSRLKILKKIRDIFFNFSSGGDTLYTLFEITKTWRKIIFIINFFNNLIIWGNKNYDENEPSIHYFTTENLTMIFSDIKDSLEIFLKQDDIIKCSNMKIYNDVDKFKNYMKIFEKNFQTFYIKRERNSSNSLNLITNSSLINISNNSGSTGNKSIQKSENTLTEINTNIRNYEKSLINLGRGNLITLTCGHNGSLNYEELETLMKYMNLSKIFEVN